MAAAIAGHDWSSTPLGSLEQWPATLKTSVALLLASRFPGCIIWGPEFVTVPNDAFLPILGEKPPALGRSFADVWAEVWDEIGPIAARALAGESTFIEDFALTIDRGRGLEPAWFTFCYSPIRDENGTVAGFLDTVVETSGKVRAERDLQFLNAELSHRLKNMLALAQSITLQTLRRATDAADASRIVSERLAALGTATGVLTGEGWQEADMLAVAHAALAPHGVAERFRIAGPALPLVPRRAVALTLALHELATNAAKYGALSVPGGSVAIDWHVEAGQLRFCWQEAGGPRVAAPTRRGFGSSVIDRALASAFDGSTMLDFRPEGLRLTLDAPVA